jgi:hypothetical protein
MATAFQSLNAAINGSGDFKAVSALINGMSGSAISIIPGQTTDYLNAQLADTLTGLQAASKLRDTTYAAGLQSANLENVKMQVADDAGTATQRHDNAIRQFEINEWTTANRQETIFVYQIIFFGILAATIIGGFWRIGFITGPLASLLTFIDLAIVVFLIVYRAQYTTFKRDRRYWNKRRFQSAGPIASLPNCPAAVDLITNLPGNLEAGASAAAQKALGGVSGALTGLGSALTSAGEATGNYKF